MKAINVLNIVNRMKKYMKTECSTIVFNDEHRATLDEPDGMVRGGLIEIVNQQGLVLQAGKL